MALRTTDSILQNALKPICFVCNKEVENFDAVQDFALCRTIFIAKCHGMEQVVDVDRVFLMENKLERGYAFTPEQRKIEHQPKLLTQED